MKGIVDSRGRALVKLSVRSTTESSETSLSAWVDTAFTGDLVLPRREVERLGLSRSTLTSVVLGDGQELQLPAFTAWIDWFGHLREVEVVASEVETALLGVTLMLGHRLVVDYRSLRLTLE
jgi:clan AA aspartic protease